MFNSSAKNILPQSRAQRWLVWTVEKDCKIDFKTYLNNLCKPFCRTFKAKDIRVSQTVSLNHHLIDTERHVMYCWLHKVASSFWMWLFLYIKVKLRFF